MVKSSARYSVNPLTVSTVPGFPVLYRKMRKQSAPDVPQRGRLQRPRFGGDRRWLVAWPRLAWSRWDRGRGAVRFGNRVPRSIDRQVGSEQIGVRPVAQDFDRLADVAYQNSVQPALFRRALFIRGKRIDPNAPASSASALRRFLIAARAGTAYHGSAAVIRISGITAGQITAN